MTRLRAGAATDTGRVRTSNQDNLLVAEGLFAVADGMGGHQGGEVASSVAVDALGRSFAADPTLEGLLDAVRAANRAVHDRARGRPELDGMGTTLTAVALVPAATGGDELVVVNVGDSRTYLLRHGELDQLTEDDSLVGQLVRDGQLDPEAARTHPQRNIITRALGLGEDVEVDPLQLTPVEGERLLLCSDGLTNDVDEREIASVLRRVADPQEAAERLVEMAYRAGGSDNITVVVVDVVDDDDRAERASAALGAVPPDPRTAQSRMLSLDERNARLRDLDREDEDPRTGAWTDAPPEPAPFADEPGRRVTGRVVAFVLVVLLLVGGGVGAVAWTARNSWFVGLDGDRVTIYKGRPGGLLWFQPTVEQATELTVDDVRPARRDALRRGKEQPSLAAARRYVGNLREEAVATAPAPEPVTPSTSSSTSTSTP